MTLRFVQLRDYDGHVHFVPNGTISSVVNMSRGFANAVMDIGVACRENTDEVVQLMRDTGRELRADPEFAGRILGELESPASTAGPIRRWSSAAASSARRWNSGACAASTCGG